MTTGRCSWPTVWNDDIYKNTFMCVGLSHFTAISWRCFVVNESTVAQESPRESWEISSAKSYVL